MLLSLAHRDLMEVAAAKVREQITQCIVYEMGVPADYLTGPVGGPVNA